VHLRQNCGHQCKTPSPASGAPPSSSRAINLAFLDKAGDRSARASEPQTSTVTSCFVFLGSSTRRSRPTIGNSHPSPSPSRSSRRSLPSRSRSLRHSLCRPPCSRLRHHRSLENHHVRIRRSLCRRARIRHRVRSRTPLGQAVFLTSGLQAPPCRRDGTSPS